MGGDPATEVVLAGMFARILPHLGERSRRLLCGAVARALGHGGVTRVAELAHVSIPTVIRGAKELDGSPDPYGRTRRIGGGPKRAIERQPGLLTALDRLIDPNTRGDPTSPLRWTCKPTRHLANALGAQGFQVSDDTVGRLLRQQGYRLQRTRKKLEGVQHPDRDAQFRYLNEQAREHLTAGQPVGSVDTKKKELVGLFPNPGQDWQPSGETVGVVGVNVHDLLEAALGRGIPYGVNDLAAGAGWISVGTDHDTAAFAVDTLAHWWVQIGAQVSPRPTRLLVTADAGGSSVERISAWEPELARFAAQYGIQVTVCHFPPGTFKWNKIEHRVFSHISANWHGRPLVRHEVIIELIGQITSRTGLPVRAGLDCDSYPLGVRGSHNKPTVMPIRRHEYHGEWNYSIQADSPPTRP
jgi:hypothetical protein